MRAALIVLAILIVLAVLAVFALSVDARRGRGGKHGLSAEKKKVMQECKTQCPSCPDEKPEGVRTCKASCKRQRFSDGCRTCIVGLGLPGECFDCLKDCIKDKVKNFKKEN